MMFLVKNLFKHGKIESTRNKGGIKVTDEEIISFDKFENNDALTFAQKVLHHVKSEDLCPVRIRVFYRDQIIF